MCKENNIEINFNKDIFPKLKYIIEITMKSVI